MLMTSLGGDEASSGSVCRDAGPGSATRRRSVRLRKIDSFVFNKSKVKTQKTTSIVLEMHKMCQLNERNLQKGFQFSGATDES